MLLSMITSERIFIMNTIEKTNKYLSRQFGTSIAIVHDVDSEQAPMQLRKSISIFVGLINGVNFYIIELNDERMFSSNESLLLKKLEDRLCDRPIIFVAKRLKTTSMTIMRQKKLGYIVPGSFCFIPEFLLQHSVQKERFISNEPLSIFATTIVMQYLEFQIDTQCPATDIDLFGSRMSKSRAITELEERKIIEVTKYGRINVITFLKSRLELWSARKWLLAPICTKVVTLEKDLIKFLPTQTFCGETALSIYTLLTPPKRRCIVMDDWQYNSIDYSVYEPETLNLDNSKLVDVHIYPMSLKVDRIHNRFYISPIALALSNIKPSDERAFSSYRELEEKITNELQNQTSLA